MTTSNTHLDMVAVHFSTRCGFNCEFCYFARVATQYPQPTPLKDIQRILAKLAAEEVREILFLGGDPVVHPQFIESLRIAKDHGLITTVLSNSWAIPSDDHFAQMTALIDNYETTVMGVSPEMHDTLTQRPQSFVHLISNLQRIASMGKIIGLCVNVVPVNLHHIFDLVDQMQQQYYIPVRQLMIQRIIPSNGSNGNRKYRLHVADVAVLMRQLDQIATQFGIPIVFEDPIPWCLVEPQYHQYLCRCEWGFTKGSINPEGLLTRCAADTHYRLGSIWDGHVQEVWQTHPLLQMFRSKRYLSAECQQCEFLERCGGGCALSSGTVQDLNPDDLYLQSQNL